MVINKSAADLDRPNLIGWPDRWRCDPVASGLRRSLLVPFGDPLFTANVNTVMPLGCNLVSRLVLSMQMFEKFH